MSEKRQKRNKSGMLRFERRSLDRDEAVEFAEENVGADKKLDGLFERRPR